MCLNCLCLLVSVLTCNLLVSLSGYTFLYEGPLYILFIVTRYLEGPVEDARRNIQMPIKEGKGGLVNAFLSSSPLSVSCVHCTEGK